jgi:hypothetical protein
MGLKAPIPNLKILYQFFAPFLTTFLTFLDRGPKAPFFTFIKFNPV